MQNLPPPAQLFTLAISYFVPRALHVAAELGVADHLADAPKSATELATATGTVPERLQRLLSLLAAHGVFARDEEGRFQHNEVSRFLQSNHPQSMRDFVMTVGGPARWRAAGELKHTVLTGETGIKKAFGIEIFDYNTANPAEGALFNRAMRAKAQGDIVATLAAYDFAHAGTIVDVGGGGGHMLAAIIEKRGGRGVLFDLPAVTDQVLAEGAPPFEVVGGSFFTDPLPAGDTYLLMNILHDWADEESKTILSSVRRAARIGAKALIIEMLMPTDGAPHPARLLDALMMSVTGGRERTQAEFSALFTATGWRLDRVVPTQRSMVILEASAI